MARLPDMTRGDREYRRERMIAAYQRGASSRAVACQFGMSCGYVREIMRNGGVARRPGAPTTGSGVAT